MLHIRNLISSGSLPTIPGFCEVTVSLVIQEVKLDDGFLIHIEK